LQRNATFAVTIIEMRPYRNGWQVFESAGVEPVFLGQEQAIDYAKGVVRASLLARSKK